MICVIWVLLCEQKCHTDTVGHQHLLVKHAVKAWGSLSACETWCERLRKFICMWNMLWKPEEVYLQVKDAVKTRGSLSGNETHVCLEVWTRHKQRHCKHSSGSGLQQQQPQKHSNLGINFGTIKIKQHYTEIWTSEINNSVWSTKIFHNQKVYFMLAGTYTTQRQTHKIMRNVSSRY